MKETLKKVFHASVLGVVGVLALLVILFEYVIFPGLTVADTYLNILSAIIGILSLVFIYHYIQWNDLIDFILGKEEEVVIPPGETELDYLPKEEVVKKKRVYKKKKTDKKKVTEKEEVKTKPKVLGEHQIKNGKPKVKSKKE
jgi:hypothetical protein